ncbi:MAG TPA: TolC family protein [Bacteroidales bacterium]|nr:TolC family protein [Bacteroidales bacterium]
MNRPFNYKSLIVLPAMCFCEIISLQAQSGILDDYVQVGLQHNLQVSRQQDHLTISQLELDQARGNYFPDISLQARYTVAEGGRTIDFPLGDLLHPVYNTLNMLTSSHQFDPLINNTENQQFYFYRPTEQETKVELVQPIFNPGIHYNYKIREEMTGMNRAQLETAKRKLVAEIKESYFNYLQALEIVRLLDQTEKLLQENLRVANSLLENDKVTIDNVYRARAELSKLKQQQSQALKAKKSGRAYFNFLLNRDLDAEIDEDTLLTLPEKPAGITEITGQAVSGRSELNVLKSAEKIADYKISNYNSNKLPTISAIVDYGFQGSDYSFTAQDDFVLASVVLKWPLFNGLQNQSLIKQSFIEKQMASDQLEETRKKIQLEVINGFYTLQAAEQSIAAARDEAQAAEQAYHVVAKKYRQGQANQLELTDARTAMTNAQQKVIIKKYEYQHAWAELERIAGSYPLQKAYQSSAESNK